MEKWEPDDFELEASSVWSFPDRGDWATHDAKYRGNWSPYIPRNVLLRYSAAGDTVLDQFAGGGTTLVEAKLLGRNAHGVDINPAAVQRCQEKTAFDRPNSGQVSIRRGDARNLDFLGDGCIDLICTHPPYADIIRYGDGVEGDLSSCPVPDFLAQIPQVAAECRRVLKPGKFCAILMGDTRKKGSIVSLGFDVMKIFEGTGLKIKEIAIKRQHNCRATAYWKGMGIRHNFLLLAHEYLFVFKK
jgi:DNA modification methylase